jgi:hypothetical protein
MGTIIVLYGIIGVLHAFYKINNPDPGKRPQWACVPTTPFLLRVGGFALIAALWPLSMFGR